jgi:hypothetical protein
MILSLLTLLGGGLMRLLPEILSLVGKRQDNLHELAMIDRQVELEKTRSLMRQDEIKVQGEVAFNVAELNALGEALSAQMKPTGLAWVDALNFLVRPLTTYYFLGAYGIFKTAMLAVALQQADAWHAIIQCYTEEDAAILTGLLSFWFVGRVCDKRRS